MKKIKRKGFVSGILIAIIIVAIVFSVVLYGSIIGYKANSKDIYKVWSEIDIGNDTFSVRFNLKKDNVYYTKSTEYYVTIRKPFFNGGGIECAVFFPIYDSDTGEKIIYAYDDILYLECRDRTIEISLKEVAEDLGLQ